MQGIVGRIAYSLDQEESDILLFYIFVLPVVPKVWKILQFFDDPIFSNSVPVSK
jgi:hypothetical protein